ncbi:hypothetical protein [Niallia sp. 01092]|uniref:hypothetical protein n=1 Tax=unclassified Niallia TaxID=2837522 RepID=UPI003FD3AF09
MLYLNQLEYEHIHYLTNTLKGGLGPGKDNVKTAGCGLCCSCMVVENLTLDSFPLEECLEMSISLKANEQPGTDMIILGPAVAEKFGLDLKMTNSAEELLDHLRNGGMAIANTGGDREAYTGVFSHGGHYITVVSAKGSTLCILDPSLSADKYEEEGRKGKVKIDGSFIYCDISILAKDCENRNPAYYLFSRK